MIKVLLSSYIRQQQNKHCQKTQYCNQQKQQLYNFCASHQQKCVSSLPEISVTGFTNFLKMKECYNPSFSVTQKPGIQKPDMLHTKKEKRILSSVIRPVDFVPFSP
jgi:hypothetical protein